jgi:hypothetical protein
MAKLARVRCKHCLKLIGTNVIKRHEKRCPDRLPSKKCPICKKIFKRKYKKQRTCSYSCSNSYFRSGENNPNWKRKQYRTTCFTFHKKKCVCCSEKFIVEVHHYDEDTENNDPRNLVPLCPTHHQYVHSRFKKLYFPMIKEYVQKFKTRHKHIRFK